MLQVKNEDPPKYAPDRHVKAGEDIIEQALSILKSRLRVPGQKFEAPSDITKFLVLRMARYEREVFSVMFLDAQHALIEFEELFAGTVDGTSVYPRVIVKRALELNASVVVLAHNHPSGRPEPSRADEYLTETLKRVLALVDVRVLDHIVVGGDQTVSFAQRGLL